MSTGTAVGGVVTYTIRQNTFGDTLPIIPADSVVEHHSVLFRVDIEVALTINGIPVCGSNVPFQVSGLHSCARLLEPTDYEGKSVLRVETRYSGLNTIRPVAADFDHSTFDLTISEAWYEAPFLITAYNVALEDEFSGPLLPGNGVGFHRHDFLYSGRGIIMEGSGKGSDGRYIQFVSGAMRWDEHYRCVLNPQDAVFEYVDSPLGAFGQLIENGTIAVDPRILPPHHRVEISASRILGQRRAEDVGQAVKGFHFDNFAGAGRAVMDAWERMGGNIHNAKVKYLGA